MKKVFSWILTILSWVALITAIVFVVLYVQGYGVEAQTYEASSATSSDGNDIFVGIFMGGFVAFVIFGFIGHLIAERKTFPYYATFPAYGVLLGIYFLVMGVKYLFLKICGSTDSFEDVCLHISDYKKSSSGGVGSAYSKSTPESALVYSVTENGFRRTLTLFDAHCEDYEAPEGVSYGKYYSKFKDDTGRYWRSYDGNKTFIREDTLRERGWRISW